MIENPFDAERDEALGVLLREMLSGADDAAFAARVRAALPVAQAGAWDILARWSRPGLAAAAVIALAAGFWFTRGAPAGGGTPVEAFATADQSPSDVLLSMSVEDR
ncbi:MAG: hypothetical protein ACHQXA_02725 [Gemmatimonadales bacterium]|jgi:hypothetical protein